VFTGVPNLALWGVLGDAGDILGDIFGDILGESKGESKWVVPCKAAFLRREESGGRVPC